MDPRTLRVLLKARGMTQSELARRVGVSRQAVSLWLRASGRVSLKGQHLVRVSEALGIAVEKLVRPLPCFEPELHGRLLARYLWDRLFPDLDDFAVALIRKHPKALARLVEVLGLYGAEKVIGGSIWRDFPNYERFIHPVRRKQLASVQRWHESLTAA